MDKFIPFQVPGCITGIKKMSRYWRITIDTQENISGDALKQINDMSDKLGWFTYNVHQIEAEDIVDLPPLRQIEKDEKTPSKRLRAIFYRLWEKDNKGFKTADDHYLFMMDSLIKFYKEKLDV